MKVEYRQIPVNFDDLAWVWSFGGAESTHHYSRRRDAVRGFYRHINQTRNVMIGRMK